MNTLFFTRQGGNGHAIPYAYHENHWMKSKLLFCFLFLNLMLLFTLSQAQDKVCGTEPTPEQIEEMDRYREEIQRFELDPNNLSRAMVPITAHIIRQSNGSGGLTQSQLTSALAIVNSYYQNANIEFYLCGSINYINNSTYYDFDANDQSTLISTYNVANTINIYFANSVTSSTGSPLCGYTYFPGGPEIVAMDNSCTTNGSTLSHELGHYFSLYHTHGKNNCSPLSDELVNGSNCATAGDDVCDTPADPNLRGLNCATSYVTGCSYTGTLTDANGHSYTPMVNNHMSYAPSSCRNAFTTGQYNRIAWSLANQRNYLTCNNNNNKPDYTITNMSTATNPIIQGTGFTINATLANQGNANYSGSASHTRLYLSTNATLGGSDVALTPTFTTPSLNAGQSQSYNFNNVVVPAGTSNGSYYIIMHVDYNDQIDESNENNNTYAIPVTVGNVQKPDYTITAMSTATNPIIPGAGFTINATLANQGNVNYSGSSSHTRLYLSSNSTLDGGDVTLTPTFTTPGLNAGQTQSFNFNNVVVPAGTSNGSYYIIMYVDYNDQIDESNENNNTYAIQVTVGNVNKPDYTVENFTSSTNTVAPGGSLVMNLTIKNIGNAAGNGAGGKDRYYLSDSPGFGGNYSELKNFDTGSLAAGASFNVNSGSLTIPNGTAPGTYYILFFIDADDVVDESNENNNVVYYQITVNAGSPDYIPVNFRLNNSTSITVNSGQSVSGSLFAKNQGSGPGTVNASGKYYFSYDNNLDGGDQVIGIDDIEPLSPGQQTPETENVTIPNGLSVGTYYVFYKVDADHVINESNENNNVASVSVTVQGSPPNANFSASNTSPCLTNGQTETITFNDQSSGSPTSYSWNFGTTNIIYMNGTNSSSQNPQVRYTAAGTYTVSLTVSNASGSDSEVKSNYINVSNCATAPVADFTPSNSNPCIGDVVTMINQTTGGATSYLWSFSPGSIIYVNGTNASSANPQVRFNVAATYSVSLTATNSAGSNTKTKNVVVSTCQTAPVANFTSDRTTICPGESVQFSSTSTGSPTSYSWSFPGGSPGSSSSPSPVVSYATPGSYMVSLTVSNSAGSNTKQVAGYITVQSVGCGGGPNWPVTQTGDNHTVIIETSAAVTVNGQPISIGDYVGAFYDDNGTQRCAGKTVWTGSNTSVTVYGDDNTTGSVKEGFSTSEVFKWKIWKASTNEEMNATATYRSPNFIITHTDQFATNGISSLASLTGSTSQTQTIVLSPGWNMISSYIQSSTPNIADIFASIQSQIALVKNGTGNVYFPSSAINTIGNWNVAHGYQVKVISNSSINLQITGQQVNPASLVINLSVGWNLFAYLRDTQQSIATALSPVQSKLIIAKNNAGQIYFPSGGINNIGNMKPGQGYQAKMSSNASLNYSTRMATPPANMHSASLFPNHYNLQRVQNGSNASLIIANNDVLNTGDEVGVFTEKGLLVGAAVYEGHTLAFPIWGDELNTSEIEGLEEGASFEVRVWNAKTQKEVPVALSFETGDQVYQTDGIIQASLQKTTNIHSLLEANSLNIYPNPSKTQATLSLGLVKTAEVKVELYNLQGKLIQVVSEDRLSTGQHEINISTAHLPDGLYHCNIIIGDVVHNISLAVMK